MNTYLSLSNKSTFMKNYINIHCHNKLIKVGSETILSFQSFELPDSVVLVKIFWVCILMYNFDSPIGFFFKHTCRICTCAFDTVWRHGLLYKLHKLGVNGKCWSIINDCHINTSSSVVVNQTQSRWFNVLQGVRQGGVLSSFLYLVFINELIDTLEHCSTCTKLLNVASNCPTLADDISLIGLTPISLQSMLNIANEYLKKMAIQIQR